MAETVKPARTIQIKVVSTNGCPGAPLTVERIRQTAAELNLTILLEEVVVTTQAEADDLRMLGSPTVQINGLDLEPALREENQYGFTWRLYGASGVPTREMIEDGLREAVGA